MLRKILVTLAVALAGLVMVGGIASADTGYGADPVTTPVLGVSGGGAAGTADDPIPLNAPFELGLSGFTPGETIDVVGSFNPAAGGTAEATPPGLRKARAIVLRSSPLNFTATADGAGASAITVSYDQAGTYTFIATGRTSGISNAVSVVVGAAGGSAGTGDSGSTGGGAAGVGSADSAGGANSVNGGASASSDGGLAYTGASVAGPLAIGIAALIAGLALLFLGTRGLIRRKGTSTTAGI